MSISISVAYVAEIERLRHDIERHIRIASELATENERLCDENRAAWDSAEYNARRARMAEAAIKGLREYANHRSNCSFHLWDSDAMTFLPCDCGYDDFIKEIEG